MPITVDTVLDGVELTERIAGDVAHTTPILKFLIKRTTTAELLKLVGEVQEHLNEAGDILNNPAAKEALHEAGLFQELFAELSDRNLELHQLDKDVKTVKRFNIFKKYNIYARVVNEEQEAYRLKINIWSKSTLSQLGFAFIDGELVPPTSQGPIATLPPQLHAPSEATLPVDSANQLPDAHDQGSVNGIPDEPDALEDTYSDTDSMYGNPWLGYVVQALARRLSSSSLHSPISVGSPSAIEPTVTTQGKQRALEIEAED